MLYSAADVTRETSNEASASESCSHLTLLGEVFDLFGLQTTAHRLLFVDPWHSLRNRAAQTLLKPYFIVRAFLGFTKTAIAQGSDLVNLRGELFVSEENIGTKSLQEAFAGKCFVVGPRARHYPVQNFIAALGLDGTAESVSAFLSINSLVILFATRAHCPVVLHVATSARAEEALGRHNRGMQIACSNLPEELKRIAPSPIALRQIDGRLVLLQYRLQGTLRSLKSRSDERVLNTLVQGIVPLQKLHEARTSIAVGPDHELIFSTLPAMIDKHRDLGDDLNPILRQLQSWQRNLGAAVTVHGDYWLRNVLYDPDVEEVTGIVDWEEARTHGTPGVDAIHFGAMSLAMEQGVPICVYLVDILLGHTNNDVLNEYIVRVKSTFSLSQDYVEHVVALLYLTLIERALRGRKRGVVLRSDLLAEPVPHFRRWVERKTKFHRPFLAES